MAPSLSVERFGLPFLIAIPFPGSVVVSLPTFAVAGAAFKA